MTARFVAVHPVLAAFDVEVSIRFFEALGFRCTFRDAAAGTRYAGLVRDGCEIHLQWNEPPAPAADGTAGDRPYLRFLVDDPDALFAELATAAGALVERAGAGSPWARPAATPWGTREFHLRDPAGNGLQFYRPLAADEAAG